MTGGEKRVANRLEQKLEDDYLLWYDVAVGPKQLHPDFIILHPLRGLLILEVKDWTLDTLHDIDRLQASLITPNGIKRVSNPLEQARQYLHSVTTQLERDPLLVAPPGSAQHGRLLIPHSYGVVLTRITRKGFDDTDLGEVIDPQRVICMDEMTEAVDAETFQQRLWAMLPYRFGKPLSLPQLDRVRWHLFPEIRIGTQLDLANPDTADFTLPDLLRVMDLQQEQLARSLGEGHRIIHGVAGSGKTLILGYRCLHLAKQLSQPILVLCYNVTLAARLAHLLHEQGLGEQVKVYNFHAWCSEQLRTYQVACPPVDGVAHHETQVQRVIDGVQSGQIPAGQYGAVMIDEGHDFQPAWLKLITQMVNPETNALLVLYDDAQSIYERSHSRRFSFSSVGIKAQGRTTILRINYRNTDEILQLAARFAHELLRAEDAEEDGIPLVQPTGAGRHGKLPEVIRLPSLQHELDVIVSRLQHAHDNGLAWGDMAVLYPSHFVGEKTQAALTRAQIPVDWLTQNRTSRQFKNTHDSVKIITLHSSKGLEFPLVAIPSAGYPLKDIVARDQARLLYVGMTRATDALLLTYSQVSPLTEQLETACQQLAA